MPPSRAYLALVLLEFALALVTMVALRFIVAPYGRHGRGGWGPTVAARVGWVIMESVSAAVFAGAYLAGAHRADLVPLVFLGMWQVHYLQRSFVYPSLMRGGHRMPVLVVLLGMAFNVLNAFINARWVSEFGRYPLGWLTDPRFLVGAAVFLGGFTLNLASDAALRGLRRPGETGYKVPQGGGFRWVSSPNYLGEIVEWLGWALATWSLPGFAFAASTIANLAPRAIANHRWYRDRFAGYPPERRALLPYLL